MKPRAAPVPAVGRCRRDLSVRPSALVYAVLHPVCPAPDAPVRVFSACSASRTRFFRLPLALISPGPSSRVWVHIRGEHGDRAPGSAAEVLCIRPPNISALLTRFHQHRARHHERDQRPAHPYHFSEPPSTSAPSRPAATQRRPGRRRVARSALPAAELVEGVRGQPDREDSREHGSRSVLENDIHYLRMLLQNRGRGSMTCSIPLFGIAGRTLQHRCLPSTPNDLC